MDNAKKSARSRQKVVFNQSKRIMKLITYHKSEIEVLIGDYVEFKNWLFFWKGWQSGRIYYVPGLSKKNRELEHDGLTWVSIHDKKGCQIGVLVIPETNQIRHTVRFVKRSDDDLYQTPKHYYFGD